MGTTEKLEYTIPAAEFARICGTTRDTLRYYEKRKVLLPWKDPENGYHYYSYAQIGSFYLISTLRSMNYSAQEICDYLLIGNYSEFLPLINVQIAALQKQQWELERKIRQLSVVRELDQIAPEKNYGHPAIQSFPKKISFRMAPIASGKAYSLSDIARDIQDHIHLFPDMAASFPAGTAMNAEAFLNGDYRYTKVISLYPTEDRDSIPPGISAGTPDPGTVEAWESVTTFSLPTLRVAGIFCRDTDGNIQTIYRRLADFIQQNHLKMKTDVFSISFLNMIGPDQKRRYLKYIFVCVASDR